MKEMLLDLVTSKKAAVAVATAIAALVGLVGFHVDPGPLAVAIAPLLAYVVGQGLADHGKEAATLNVQAAQLRLQSLRGPVDGTTVIVGGAP